MLSLDAHCQLDNSLNSPLFDDATLQYSSMSFRLKRSITTADLDLHDQAHCDCQACARARRQNAVTRSKEYWLENDTVVVQVERTLYKLSRGWLIRKSDYFRNLLKDHPASPDVGAKRLIVDANIVYVVEAAVSSHDFEQLLACIDKGLYVPIIFLQRAHDLLHITRMPGNMRFPYPRSFKLLPFSVQQPHFPSLSLSHSQGAPWRSCGPRTSIS